MSNELKERHPTLMVPHVVTFGVVIYTNGGMPAWPQDLLRDALVAALPPGTGVSQVTCTNHGVYDGKQGAQ